MSLASLIVDFNSYFASVEQQVQPELRGRPVAVVPMLADTTCAIAASYEAKRFGVKTGTLVREARQMCPEITFVEARHEVYIDYHHRLIKAVDSCAPVQEVLSIDEMLVALTGKYQARAEAESLAVRMKAAVAGVGECFKCSIGIAPNPFLAKTASDMQKPDGLVVIEQGDLPQVLHRLELRDLCGIGEAMEERLHKARIETVEQLCSAPKSVLHGVWGSVGGNRMYEQLRGNFVPRLETNHSSVGHSHVLAPDERGDEQAGAILHRMVQKAAMRLRKMGYLSGGLAVSVKYLSGRKWGEEIRFNETDDTLECIHALGKVWERRPAAHAAPLKVGVTLTHLAPRDQVTPSLFAGPRNRDRLNKIVDALNVRYGRQSAYYGGAHDALRSAPMRIAFNHVPDLETESDR